MYSCIPTNLGIFVFVIIDFVLAQKLQLIVRAFKMPKIDLLWINRAYLMFSKVSRSILYFDGVIEQTVLRQNIRILSIDRLHNSQSRNSIGGRLIGLERD